MSQARTRHAENEQMARDWIGNIVEHYKLVKFRPTAVYLDSCACNQLDQQHRFELLTRLRRQRRSNNIQPNVSQLFVT